MKRIFCWHRLVAASLLSVLVPLGAVHASLVTWEFFGTVAKTREDGGSTLDSSIWTEGLHGRMTFDADTLPEPGTRTFRFDVPLNSLVVDIGIFTFTYPAGSDRFGLSLQGGRSEFGVSVFDSATLTGTSSVDPTFMSHDGRFDMFLPPSSFPGFDNSALPTELPDSGLSGGIFYITGDVGPNQHFRIDGNISLLRQVLIAAPVPEPTTAALLVLGLMGLGFYQLRKQRREV